MHVTELSYDEKLQLKEELFYGSDFLPDMNECQKAEIEEAMCADDISDELVHELYYHYDFIKDDFWFNMED